MTARWEDCKTCGQSSARAICDRCGADVTQQPDAIRVQLNRIDSPGQRSQLDYCHGCAAKEIPLAVGIAPGSDLPAELHPRKAT